MNQIIAITCHDYSDYSKVTGSVDLELTTDGKLSISYLEDHFNLRTVEIIMVLNGIEKCVLIGYDASTGLSDCSFANVQSLKITGESTLSPQKKQSVTFSTVTADDCKRTYGLGLDLRYADIDAPTLHVPSDFNPDLAPSDALCQHLHRIKKAWVLDNEQSCRMIIDAILTEALLDEASENLLGFCEVKNDWAGSGLAYYGNVDYMLGSSPARLPEHIDSQLVVMNANVDWLRRDVAQVLAEAGCLLKNRMAKGKMTPVFAVLTNAQLFRFFAVDVDGVVYSSGNLPLILDVGSDRTYRNSPTLCAILRWFNWFITSSASISARPSSEDRSQAEIADSLRRVRSCFGLNLQLSSHERHR